MVVTSSSSDEQCADVFGSPRQKWPFLLLSGPDLKAHILLLTKSL